MIFSTELYSKTTQSTQQKVFIIVAFYRYAECRYAECHYAEWGGALLDIDNSSSFMTFSND
jgi:hypothetical protein